MFALLFCYSLWLSFGIDYGNLNQYFTSCVAHNLFITFISSFGFIRRCSNNFNYYPINERR